MKILISILFILLSVCANAQTDRYRNWKTDSLHRHDSSLRKYDTALFRIRKVFWVYQRNYRNAKTKEDSIVWVKKYDSVLRILQPLERKREDENLEFGRKNNFRNK